MSIPGSANPMLLASAAGGPTGYLIERSLRFNSSDSAFEGKPVNRIRKMPPLSFFQERLEYDADTGEFTWLGDFNAKRVGRRAGTTVGAKGYRTITIKKCRYYEHRIAWYMMTNEDPTGFEIDHINGNKADNRLSNLRLATCQTNKANCGLNRSNTSGFKGVHKFRKRWIASITHDRKIIHLGVFDTPEIASKAYDAKAIELFGEYALTNAQLQEVAA
jgi:hypothetical protein